MSIWKIDWQAIAAIVSAVTAASAAYAAHILIQIDERAAVRQKIASTAMRCRWPSQFSASFGRLLQWLSR